MDFCVYRARGLQEGVFVGMASLLWKSWGDKEELYQLEKTGKLLWEESLIG